MLCSVKKKHVPNVQFIPPPGFLCNPQKKKNGTLIYLFLDFWIVQKKGKRLGKQQFQFHY